MCHLLCYRRIHTESARHWLDRLEEDSVQLLVCLTFADQLYEELMSEDGTHPSPEIVKKEISTHLDVSRIVYQMRLTALSIFILS